MLELLLDIQERSAVEDRYVEDATARNLQATLNSLPAEAPIAERFRLNASLGYHELILGRNDKSIRHLETASHSLSELPDKMRKSVRTSLPMLLGLAYLRKAETEN